MPFAIVLATTNNLFDIYLYFALKKRISYYEIKYAKWGTDGWMAEWMRQRRGSIRSLSPALVRRYQKEININIKYKNKKEKFIKFILKTIKGKFLFFINVLASFFVYF